ncbi:hypothetical protein IL306_004670 [Fusarium sp. DS 682]|nr:hypothetical protein IL306_004670 [Fusarium sp. DS 682]
MSRKPPSQTSYVQFGRDRLLRQQAAVFSKLNESIPKNENQWQEAREVHRFATPEDVYRTVSSLVQDVQDEFLPEDLRRLIYIAVCCVDYSENEAEAYRKYRSRIRAKDDLGELTIRNYMSLVRGLVALMDKLYPKLQHRGFEGTLRYVASSDKKGRYDPVRDEWLPVTTSNLTGYKLNAIPESIQ